MTIEIERIDDFKKTELHLDFGKNKQKQARDIKLTLRGGEYTCSTKGLDDKVHKRVSTIWKTFATRDTLKIPPSHKFNMVENLARACRDFSEFLVRFTEHNIYQMPTSLPAVTTPALPKVAKDEMVEVEVVEGVKITRVVKKPVRTITQRANVTELAGVLPAEPRKVLKRTQTAIDKATKLLDKAMKPKKEKARAEKPQDTSREGTGAKYVYPEGMTADEKKKFRAAARAKAKKAAG